MHAMATEAVVGQMPLAIVRFIEEDFLIRDGVRPSGPARIFLLMTASASRAHLLHIVRFQADLFVDISREMDDNPAGIFQMKPEVRRQNAPVTIGARHVAVSGRMPLVIGR
jgi:hypothetical protein